MEQFWSRQLLDFWKVVGRVVVVVVWDFVIAGSKECSGTQGYLFFQIAFFNQMLY